ncbi:MAG TPA: transcriptional regulator [Acidobacteriota bacterium]|nr:transcriptional regulator [Acidobacteriota bacterium]
MNEPSSHPDLSPLEHIDQVIHAPARLMILTYLYVVDSVDYVFLMRITGLTWGNLSTHLAKLEDAGYVVIKKGYKGRKPHTTIRLSNPGRTAFKEYKRSMKQVLDDLPD